MMIALRQITPFLLILALGLVFPMASAQAQTSQPPAQSMDDALAAPDDTPAEPASDGTSKASFKLGTETEALKLTDDIALAKAQLRKHPNNPEAHFLMAAAYSRSPHLDKAFKHIRKVKQMLKEKKDFEFIDRTIAEYEDLQATNPDNPVLLYRLAMGYYFKGYSLERYPQHYKNTPTGDAKAYYQKAENAMRRVIELNPQDIWARNYLGYLVTENGRDLARAIKIWEESLAINRDQNAGAYLLLSQAYLQKGDLQNALIYGAKGLEVKHAMGMKLP